MWKGVVSFGMVSIPIRLYNATESTAKVSFRQLCPEHRSPISYKRWCPEGEHEVAYGEILKGFEVGKDRYVIINEKDLDNVPLATAHSIDIHEFVPSDDIEPGLYYNSASRRSWARSHTTSCGRRWRRPAEWPLRRSRCATASAWPRFTRPATYC
jgi:Ku protein